MTNNLYSSPTLPTHKSIQQAVIYCRVSSGKQIREGDGLTSQETRCKEYAERQGWEIIGIYHDTGISGGLLDRPAINKIRSFLESQTNEICVIVDDISRWAREIEHHFTLKRAIKHSGGTLISLNQKLDDGSPEGKFMESIYAAHAEMERNSNIRRTTSRMQCRLMKGRWVFKVPVGYKYVQGDGKILVRDEPAASIVVEALDGYASDRFNSHAEVKAFLETHPSYPHNKNGRVHCRRVEDLLNQLLYTGYFITQSGIYTCNLPYMKP